MSPISLNFEGTGDRQPAEDGTYNISVKSASIGPSKASGKTTLYIQAMITDPGDDYGKIAFYNKSLVIQSQGQAYYLRKDLEALMGAEFVVEEDGSFELDEDDLVGLNARAIIVQDEYEGRVSNKVQNFLPALPNGDENLLNLPQAPEAGDSSNPFG